LSTHLRLQPRVRCRQPRSRRDRIKQRGIVEHLRVVDEGYHLLPVPLHTSDTPGRIPVREVDRLPGSVHIEATREPVGDLEARIAECARERIPQRSRPLLAEFENEIGHGCPLPRRA